MHFLITCTAGVESLVKRDIESLGLSVTRTRDRLVECNGNDFDLARLNIWLRTANRVYVVLDTFIARDFDTYFDQLQRIPWEVYIPPLAPFTVDAVSLRSQLTSVPSLQAVARRSIAKYLIQQGRPSEHHVSGLFLQEDHGFAKQELLMFFDGDECMVLLNSSGEALHKRGYRLNSEAPLKETLAAALVQLSVWRFKEPFYDIFCGSGTIPIEASMIAKNIAPGGARSFAFNYWQWYDMSAFDKAKMQARELQRSSDHVICGSDIDPYAIENARENATRAGLTDMITWEVADAESALEKIPAPAWIVSNPPYGKRIGEEIYQDVNKKIVRAFEEKPLLFGGIITNSELQVASRQYKRRKLYNGSMECAFYRFL